MLVLRFIFISMLARRRDLRMLEATTATLSASVAAAAASSVAFRISSWFFLTVVSKPILAEASKEPSAISKEPPRRVELQLTLLESSIDLVRLDCRRLGAAARLVCFKAVPVLTPMLNKDFRRLSSKPSAGFEESLINN